MIIILTVYKLNNPIFFIDFQSISKYIQITLKYRFLTQNKIVLAQYLRTVISEIISSEAKRNIHLPKKRDLAIEYGKLVNFHLKEGFRLTEYAQLLHISPNHLNKIVKAKYGKSAQSIHNEIVLHAQYRIRFSLKVLRDVTARINLQRCYIWCCQQFRLVMANEA